MHCGSTSYYTYPVAVCEQTVRNPVFLKIRHTVLDPWSDRIAYGTRLLHDLLLHIERISVFLGRILLPIHYKIFRKNSLSVKRPKVERIFMKFCYRIFREYKIFICKFAQSRNIRCEHRALFTESRNDRAYITH